MKDLIKSISSSEWKFAVLLSVIMIFVTGLPYLYGYLMTQPGSFYNGLHALAPGDIPVYYSYINQAKSGEMLVKNLFTSEPQISGTFNVWWVGVGLFARLFSLSVIFAFQFFRLLMIPVFIFVAYLFISYLFKNVSKRKIALLFLLFSSGLGFYFATPFEILGPDGGGEVYRWPIDLWLTEANTFNALYQTSHFIASISLMLGIFLLMLLAFEKKKISHAIFSGLLCLFYFNFHPYYFPVIFGVLGGYLFILFFLQKKILWRELGYLALAFLISLPSVLYHLWLIVASPAIGQRAVQNITNISPPIFILVGYGFLWLGLILGLYFLFKNKKFNSGYLFLVIWLLINLFLIYSPFPFHSRYTQGLHFILVIFTVSGLFDLWYFLKKKTSPKFFDFWINNKALLFMLFMLLFSTSNLYSVGRDIYFFTTQNKQVKEKLYLSGDLVSALRWLGHAGQKDSVVLADAAISAKFVPPFSGKKTYIAHAHETLFADSKRPFLLWFFRSNKQDEAKLRFLKNEKIDYILYSDYEKKLGDFDPASKDYLILVFDSPNAQIYQLAKD